jgi:hypothetical protein
MNLVRKSKTDFVTKNQVEEILGLRFTRTEKEGEINPPIGAEYFHYFKQDISSSFHLSMGMFDDPKFRRITFIWSTHPCLKYEQIKADIDAIGWDAGRRRKMLAGSDITFVKPEKEVTEKQKRIRNELRISSHFTVVFLNKSSDCVKAFQIYQLKD